MGFSVHGRQRRGLGALRPVLSEPKRVVALEFGDNFLRDENSAMEKTLANQSVMAKLSLHDMEGSAAVLVAHRPDDDGVGCHAAGIHTLTAQGFEVLHFRIDSAGCFHQRISCSHDNVKSENRGRESQIQTRLGVVC